MPHEELYGLTPRQYGENIGGIYPFYTERATEAGIKEESTRFITDGQKETSPGRFHNAIIMWNPRQVQFPDNICPYKERFDHGLEAINAIECEMLGIFFIPVIDEKITEKEARMIEKAAHYAVNDWEIPKRLFRVPGAGKGNLSTAQDGKRRVIGITCLPPDFFENNPNVCVVASAR